MTKVVAFELAFVRHFSNHLRELLVRLYCYYAISNERDTDRTIAMPPIIILKLILY